MTSANESRRNDHGLPMRDLVLVPVLACFTVIALFACTEVVARKTFRVSKSTLASCMVMNDPSTGFRAIPDSVCWEKSPESEGEEYRFNNCGHRAGMACGPKPKGVYRIVTIGSSTVLGERVQRDQSFAALLPALLSKATGKNVEVYNEGMGGGFSLSAYLRFHDALAQQPDLILWAVTPNDIMASSHALIEVDKIGLDRSMSLEQKTWLRLKRDFGSESPTAALAELFSHTRTAVMLEHYLFESQSQYIKSTLMESDSDIGYLKTQSSPLWSSNLNDFERNAAGIEMQSKNAGVPFVACLLPSRVQASMISMGQWPAGYDPFKLDNTLRTIITRHGGIYVDILPDYRKIPDAEHYYFPVDGHPMPKGHAIIARLLTEQLTGGAVPGLQPAAMATNTNSEAY